MDAQQIISELKLIKSPTEGGYYRETFRSETANDIYYLLTHDEICTLHKVSVPTEIYSFYLGDPVEMLMIDRQGQLARTVLGNDLSQGQLPKIIVPANSWQGLKIVSGGNWVLLGITCAPAFEPPHYEGGELTKFAQLFPHHLELLRPFVE